MGTGWCRFDGGMGLLWMVVRTRGTPILPQGRFALLIWVRGGIVNLSIVNNVHIGRGWGLLTILPLVNNGNMGVEFFPSYWSVCGK